MTFWLVNITNTLARITWMQTDQFWGAHASGRMFRSKMTSNLVHEKIPCELTLRPMNDPAFETNSDRVCNRMSRRLFLRATLAGGASLLAGRAATLFAAASASDDSSFSIGGDLTVNRLGFGAMWRAGEGIWGWRPVPENVSKVLRCAGELGANLIKTADAY